MFRSLRYPVAHTLKLLKKQTRLLSSSYLNGAALSDPKENIVPYAEDYSIEKCDLRRQWVEQYAGSSLRNVSQWWIGGGKSDIVEGHIEMPIGLAKIPLAVAGPLQINGSFAQGKFLAPLAITEGAVVASTNRGAGALNISGGVTAYTSQLRTSSCPVFEANTAEDAHALGEWVKNQRDQIQQEVVSKCSKNLALKEILSVYDLQFVHLLLNYESGEVVEPATTSLVTSQVTKWIVQKAPKNLQLRRYWKESHLSGEGKCSRLNMILGRGISCGAEAVIPEEVFTKNLGLSAESFHECWRMGERSTDRSLSMGNNGNTANITSAIFAATGQDLGRCVDASATKTQCTLLGPGGGMKYTVWIPSLVIRTQHEGSDLPTQKQCLELVGCYGANKVRKLAEIIAAFTLALDLSTCSAVAAGYFTAAHEQLGKNRPT